LIPKRSMWPWFFITLISIAVVLTIHTLRQPPPGTKVDHQPLQGWPAYKMAFMASDGRIIDTGNHHVSHSEGQGYGMLFAVNADDPSSFEKIWQWTHQHLQIRDDALLAWRYQPGSGVTDINNASDGDILVAWALLQAGQRWKKSHYIDDSRQILQDIRNKLIRPWRELEILLPGVMGFERGPDDYTVNLSYWIFPAFRDFQIYDPSPQWSALEQSGLQLIRQSRFGRWQLPPDWLRLDQSVQPAPDRPPRFGYDAIRVPLHLSWAGINQIEFIQPFTLYQQAMYQREQRLPPWINLTTNDIASYDAANGIKAVFTHLKRPITAPGLPGPHDDYYSASLLLLVELSQQKRL